jgi:hypothetical protein
MLVEQHLIARKDLMEAQGKTISKKDIKGIND